MHYTLFTTYKTDFDNIASENETEHNLNWRYIPDHPCRILIIGGSGSGKTNALLNLIKEQDNEKQRHSQDLFVCQRPKQTKISAINQALPPWIRVLRNEFNKIKDHIMSLKDNQLITRTYDKQYDFNITKELIKR